jgi:hypothetical protein
MRSWLPSRWLLCGLRAFTALLGPSAVLVRACASVNETLAQQEADLAVKLKKSWPAVIQAPASWRMRP